MCSVLSMRSVTPGGNKKPREFSDTRIPKRANNVTAKRKKQERSPTDAGICSNQQDKGPNCVNKTIATKRVLTSLPPLFLLQSILQTRRRERGRRKKHRREREGHTHTRCEFKQSFTTNRKRLVYLKKRPSAFGLAHQVRNPSLHTHTETDASTCHALLNARFRIAQQ